MRGSEVQQRNNPCSLFGKKETKNYIRLNYDEIWIYLMIFLVCFVECFASF